MGICWEFMYGTGNSLGNSWESIGNRTGTEMAYFDIKDRVNGSNFLVEIFREISIDKSYNNTQ